MKKKKSKGNPFDEKNIFYQFNLAREEKKQFFVEIKNKIYCKVLSSIEREILRCCDIAFEVHGKFINAEQLHSLMIEIIMQPTMANREKI